MMASWNNILKLPDTCLAGGQRVPKTMLVKQGGLSKAQERMLDNLRDVRFFASLTRSSTHMVPVKDDVYDVESVVFLACGLTSTKGIAETARVLHGCFPNPTVLLMEGSSSGEIAVSVAIRRKSEAERGAFVTERIASSGQFSPGDSVYEQYFRRIAYPAMPQTDLLAYTTALADRSALAHLVRQLGFYPVCKDTDADLLMGHVRKMRGISSKVSELRDMRKLRTTTLAESTKLRVEIKKLEKQLDEIQKQIKDLCDSPDGLFA